MYLLLVTVIAELCSVVGMVHVSVVLVAGSILEPGFFLKKTFNFSPNCNRVYFN